MVQLEEARIVAAQSVIAAGEAAERAAAEAVLAAAVAAEMVVAAERAAAIVQASPVSVASSDALDAGDRARARRLADVAAGVSIGTDQGIDVLVEVSSDEEEEDEPVGSQAELGEFADALDVMAAALVEHEEEEYDIGFPDTYNNPPTTEVL